MTFSTFSAMPLNSSNVAVNTQLSVIANGKNMGNILLFGDFGCQWRTQTVPDGGVKLYQSG